MKKCVQSEVMKCSVQQALRKCKLFFPIRSEEVLLCPSTDEKCIMYYCNFKSEVNKCFDVKQVVKKFNSNQQEIKKCNNVQQEVRKCISVQHEAMTCNTVQHDVTKQNSFR